MHIAFRLLTIRTVMPWLALAAGVAVLLSQGNLLTALSSVGLHDYVAYWSAGRLNAWGGNPYSPAELLPVQQAVGWDEDWPNIMYYPPWALPVVMPFGLLPYGPSRLLWLMAHMGLLVLGAEWGWRYFGGSPARRWIAYAICFSFVPTLMVLRMGQIGPLMLIGILGFLLAQKANKDWLAGSCLVLAAIKPQLIYLFGLAVVLWAIDQRRWRILLGGMVAVLVAVSLALVKNPSVLDQYRYALANPPSGNITPTLGAILRLALGQEHTWLQFVPTIVGLALFPIYWLRHRQRWQWEEQSGVLLLVSFLTTAYGAWVFDMVILLVPIMQGAIWAADRQDRRIAIAALAGYVTIDAVALGMNLGGAAYPAFIWMTPAIFIWYILMRRYRGCEPALTPDLI